jgi:ABC-type amino acid transport system permease subunit
MTMPHILWKLWKGYPTSLEFINSDYPVFMQTLAGLQLTILITFLSICVAFIPAAVFAYIYHKALKRGSSKYFSGRIAIFAKYLIITVVEFFRGIPLVLLVLLVFILPYPLFGIRLPLVLRAVIAMSIYAGIYIFTIFLSGFKAVSEDLLAAAKVMGLNRFQIFIKLQLPLSVRVMLPTFLSMVITVFKDSSVLYVAGVCELTFTSRQIIISQPGDYFFILFSVLAIYWGIATAGSLVVKLLEEKYRFNFNH